MGLLRKNSLEPVQLSNWRWHPFLSKAIDQISVFRPKSISIPPRFLYREEGLGSVKKSIKARVSTWGCQTNKIRQAKAACIEAGSITSVLNFVITPLNKYELPFFGADFVTLPTGHLIAIDFQPALKNDVIHTKFVWDLLLPLHQKWQSLLPAGGPIPKEAKPYFSPGFLWTRFPLGLDGDNIINDVVFPAFSDYLELYLDLVEKAELISFSRSKKILHGQNRYMNYRAEKDPARSMLTRMYGNEWTELYINEVLFQL